MTTTNIRAECDLIDAEIKELEEQHLDDLRVLTESEREIADRNLTIVQQTAEIVRLTAEIARLTALLPKPRFRMFDASMNYILGTKYERMPLVPESALYPTTARGKPDRNHILTVAMPKWRAANPTATMICLDDEWRNTRQVGDILAITAAEVADYVTLVNIVKEFDPSLKVSVYGLPLRSQNHLTSGVTGAEAAWFKSQAHFKPLIDVMDFGTTSLYVLTTDLALFKRYLKSNLDMWRAVAGSKPNYPFICPTYHQNVGAALAKKPIPGAMMEATLQACLAGADGFCLWDWAANKLDKSAAWYGELERFRVARAVR